MKCFRVSVLKIFSAKQLVSLPENIKVPLLPGSITHFCNNRGKCGAIRSEAVIHIEWTEIVAPGPQLCQKADGPIH